MAGKDSMVSTIKIKRRVEAEVEISVAELAEKFSAAELASAGLYRNKSDALLAQERSFAEQVRRESLDCEDEDCPCEMHTRDLARLRRSMVKSETQFWHELRELLLRRDTRGVARAIEDRAWGQGNVAIPIDSHLH